MKTYQYLLNSGQFKQALDHVDKEVYLAAYKHAKYNQSETARLLKVSRGTVISKLRKFLANE